MNKFDRNEWNFPFDWVSKKLQDMDEVFDEISTLENEHLTITQKDDVRMQYLSNQYLDDATLDDLREKKHERLFPQKKLTDEELE